MARIGKIARLPEDVREELNKRIRGGKLGPEILPWLNGLESVRQVVGEWFHGQEVTTQNLSEWRHGGYAEWARHQDRFWQVREMAGFAAKLTASQGSSSIAEGAAAIAAGRILELLEKSLEDGGKLDLEQFQGVVSSLVRLRESETAKRQADLAGEKLKRKDEELGLAKAAFGQRLREYEDKVAAQKREIESALTVAREGGLTEETLKRIEDAAALL